MTCEISPTVGFIAAASSAVEKATCEQPDIAKTAANILLDLASFRPSSKTMVSGHEVLLTQQHINLTVLHGPHAEGVKQGVLSIFTKLPEYKRLPAEWHHRC